MRSMTNVAVVLAVLACTAGASAEWRIGIQSDTIVLGQDVRLYFTASWDAPLASLTLPVVVREIDSGCFWYFHPDAGPCDTVGGRTVNVWWSWPESDWAHTSEFRPLPGCLDPNNAYDCVSPDNFVILVNALGDPLSPRPEGCSLLHIEFGSTTSVGQFEFDTACASPAWSTISLRDGSGIDHGPLGTGETVFDKGVISLVPPGPCDCPLFCDLNRDGVRNPADVVILINYVYKGLDQRQQIPGCPAENGDYTCDGQINPLDAHALVMYMYKCGDARYRCGFPSPCDPCACVQYPADCPPWP